LILPSNFVRINPDWLLALRYERLKSKKSATFIRDSWQRYGYRRKDDEVFDLKQFSIGIPTQRQTGIS
jgi:hypothetical protein